MAQFFGKTFWYALCLIVGFYILGFIGYHTDFSLGILIALTIGSAVIALRSVDTALYLPFIELFSNPHGVLITTEVSGFSVTLRMAIFIGIMLGWGIGVITKKYKPRLYDGRAQIFMILGVAVLLGFILGALTRDFMVVFSDGNAYLYLLYLLPILSVDWSQKNRHDLLQILAAGALWIASLSFITLYIFTHFGEDILRLTYEFLRDLRIAEITSLEGGAYRVFIQSHLFTIIFGLLVFSITRRQSRRWVMGLMVVILATILLSLSRSFWVGVIPALVFLLIVLYQSHHPNIRTLTSFLSWSVLTGLLSVLLLFTIVYFPIPRERVTGASLVDSLRERTSDRDDVAISSRWKLLPVLSTEIMQHPLLGQGFGASVTFVTDDPRVREIHPDGTWTTTAFEWGWMELWLKMGFLGPLGFLYAAYELIRRLWPYTWTEHAWIGYGFIAGIIFLYSTHFFSPYLNHPIGLGFLLFLVPFLSIKKPSAMPVSVFLGDGLKRTKQSAAVVTSHTFQS